jgi:hypothetical protein
MLHNKLTREPKLTRRSEARVPTEDVSAHSITYVTEGLPTVGDRKSDHLCSAGVKARDAITCMAIKLLIDIRKAKIS